ncbi:hypothetical protein J4E85_006888 [Alternaria conjuncta]|uniref:uncharacterized protein n=1 Tax=Alternaria conjuncta TaxID=181017 RepID=UPI00221E81C1|nr:uncharacterized protein J4E85_006888 [Alternaria conjuncta]KAI4926594.1 hypothetical protein J4E85_006888 [Alternaria conjuncta]
MWWDMCPIGAQQFQEFANETLPIQTHEPLAEVLEEIGIGSTNNSRRVVDFNAFMASRGDRPIYSRLMLRNAANQLPLIGEGQKITLTTCFGQTLVLQPKRACLPGEHPVLSYRGPHHLAVSSQHEKAKTWHLLPVHGECEKMAMEKSYLANAATYYSKFAQLVSWGGSKARPTFLESVQSFKHTAPISNIVCIGMGTLHGSNMESVKSMSKHVVASTLALDLTRLYKQNGVPLENPITIIAQDSAYTERDRALLSELPVPIQTVTEPEGFLAINESSLVISSYSGAPVKQIIADLATEAPHRKGPAALFLNNDKAPDVDCISYDWDNPVVANNPETRAYATMLESYTHVMNGTQIFGAAGFPIQISHEWLAKMSIWVREE